MNRIGFFIFFYILFSIQSNAQRWKTIKRIVDTSFISELRIYHCECTGSRDIDVDSGFLRAPDSLLLHLRKLPTMDISEKHWKRIFGSWKKKGFGYTYLVRGKITSVIDRGYVPKAGPRYIPVFDVYQYKVLKKRI
jgi:hypothetical protein